MITEEIAQFIVSLKFEDIPLSAIEQAKICFLDFLGVSLRGSNSNSSQIALNVMKSLENLISQTGGCTIVGNGKGNVMDASLINGISAHSLDLDDGHRLAQLHPGCTVIPAALSISEHLDKSGKDFLEAIVAGYEVAIVLGKLINPYHRNQGFHSTGTVGTLAAAAAACKILNLNKEKTINALGLAGTQAAGLLESDHAGTMGKHLHAGRASQSGVLSALIAENGFTGASSILGGKEGFLKAMCGEFVSDVNGEHMISVNHEFKEEDNPSYDLIKSAIKSDLGKFHIKEVYLKKYPVCRHLHSTIDSARSIIQDLGFEKLEGAQINKIIVKTYKIAAEHDNYNPQTPEAVRQSLPVSLGIFLIKGDLKLDHIGEKFIITPETREIADKIVIEIDEELDALKPDKRPSRVIIELKKSSLETADQINSNILNLDKIEKTTFLPQGEPENPFTKKEILDKFHLLNPEFDKKGLENLDEFIMTQMESQKMRKIMDNFNQ
jgi:2-methylcitrate dehydratase PrpD